MGQIVKICSTDMRNALQNATRQYYVGDLSRPQAIEFIKDVRVEIGLSCYQEYQSEPAHTHSVATEYQYVICGWTEYLDVKTGETYEFKTGDFYAIVPGTEYAQRVKAGTKILFIKVPSVNDKRIVGLNEEQLLWCNAKMKTVRTDYYHKDNAPLANSIKPAAAVAIFNERNEILMLHRRDNGMWTMPGGTMEFGESLTNCALREVKEECGLDVKIQDIVGTYTDPNIKIGYSDGEVRQEFTILYYGMAQGAVVLDDESSQYKWISLDRVFSLQMADSQKRRIRDVVEFLKTGQRKLI